MTGLINNILNGKHPSLEEFMDAFNSKLELLNHFLTTPQDLLWHGEGNVYNHTQLVLEQVYKLIDTQASHLSKDQKLSLILAAVLHDIGKPLVTKSKEINGVNRIVSPYHEEKGCSYLAYRLLESEIPYPVVQNVLRLVAYHHMPRRLVIQNARKQEYYCLARLVNVELLFYLAKADILGRYCADQQGQVDSIELFRLFCEEFNLWGKVNPYEDWMRFYNSELTHLTSESRDAVLGYAIQDFERGIIFTPEEAIARQYPYLKSFPQVVLMSGPSGSGKSTWIEKCLKGHHKISLDELREEYGKRRSNQEQNSFILSKAKELLKSHLGKHEKVVWDATNLKCDFRKMISQLGYDYHALVTLVVMHISESSIYRGNQSRAYQVPTEVVQSQLELLEWVKDTEAHRVAYVNREGDTDVRGKCEC